ncbi:flagellar biosynthesis anti-sigma factor FlgM [Anaerobranca gottschalkii]|uniref:Negative regulator of flagellin synthesis n=1 Tax=Anaerobranca gottschalkii DSM 13577 TaxID=1120990 RepID=A0A1H9ZHH8_9FIRM|nr:flagellar biosynthesis anti-sigma factor FlgM [Anaerobranca gottschalkii]SES81144.1 anti-sigma-28 factor, FlgM family [Anaerobranca gottschalkii DSM 13577]
MKINNLTGIIKSYNLTNKEKNIDIKREHKLEDKFEISQRAKEIAIAKKALAETPDVRMDKVEGIKKKIEEGTYTIDPAQIAVKMLSRR